MTYDVDYFIAKFDAIPAHKWCEIALHLNDQSCALGHCGTTQTEGLGYTFTEEGKALCALFPHGDMDVTDANDGVGYAADFGSTPKDRVLNILKLRKTQQQPA